MRRRHPKLRACGQWGVWVCTGGIVVLLFVSIFVPRSLHLSHVGIPPQSIATGLRVDLAESRIAIVYFPPHDSEGELASGWEMSVRPPPWYAVMSRRWWSLALWDRRPFLNDGHDIEIPLVYPAVLMLGWSLWLMRGRRKLRSRVGCCSECGYSLDGLESDVCPECGEQYAQRGV